MTSHGRRSSTGRPSLNGLGQLPALQASNNTNPTKCSYLSPSDSRVEKSKATSTTDSSSSDRLHNLISVGGQSGISAVTEESRKAVEKCHLWQFDVIELETITNHRCVYILSDILIFNGK